MIQIFNNGDKVKDRVTGLKGIVVATTIWLNGCIRYLVQPQELKDGKPVETTYFDQNDLELVKSTVVPGLDTTRRGGPMRNENITKGR